MPESRDAQAPPSVDWWGLALLSFGLGGLILATLMAGILLVARLLVALCAGVGCYLMVTKVKSIFGYDDSLDAFLEPPDEAHEALGGLEVAPVEHQAARVDLPEQPHVVVGAG